MPEGPEIRLEADQIAKILEGYVISAVEITVEALHAWAQAIEGQRVTRVYPRGKAMLIALENGLTIYSHNQLYGRWYTRTRGALPKTNRQLRLALYTEKGLAALYSASDIEVLTSNELEAHPFLAKLGPDVLDSELTEAAIRDRLNQKEFSNRRLGTLYLDQHFLAGIGNYLRSEILFDACVHPNARPRDLSKAERTVLAKSTLRICRRAYKDKGVVNDPRRVVELRAQGLERSEFRFAVFSRANAPCYKCDTPIERLEITSRRLYLCPSCQPHGDTA